MWVENEGIQIKWVVNSQNIHTYRYSGPGVRARLIICKVNGFIRRWTGNFLALEISKNIYPYCTTKGPGSSINMKETVMKAQFEYTCSTHGN